MSVKLTDDRVGGFYNHIATPGALSARYLRLHEVSGEWQHKHRITWLKHMLAPRVDSVLERDEGLCPEVSAGPLPFDTP